MHFMQFMQIMQNPITFPASTKLMALLSILPVLTFAFGLAAGVGATLLVSERAANMAIARVAKAEAPSAPIAPSAPAPALAPTQAPAQAQADTVPMSSVLDGARNYARVGKADAPVQIVVFADPQCPYCRKLSLEAEQEILKTYVDGGKAALTYRHDILFGDESQRIAVAMECAGRQGKFHDFNQYVFAHQFPENSGQATDAAMLAWAKATSLDLAQFQTCVSDPDARAGIDADGQVAQQLRIQGTPMIYINGKGMPGALPFSVLSKVIDDQLALAAR